MLTDTFRAPATKVTPMRSVTKSGPEVLVVSLTTVCCICKEVVFLSGPYMSSHGSWVNGLFVTCAGSGQISTTVQGCCG